MSTDVNGKIFDNTYDEILSQRQVSDDISRDLIFFLLI